MKSLRNLLVTIQKSLIINKMRVLCICLLFLDVSAKAYIISGKVVSESDGKPIEFASVFLANTTIGTLTNEKGSFKLTIDKPGMYQIVVSHMNCQTYSLELQISSDIIDLRIKMTEKAHELKTVTISMDAGKRALYYSMFKEQFIGTSKNAEACKIENPLIINFSYNDENRTLEAFADTFIVVTNKALGYRIKYKLELFKVTPEEAIFYGYPLFEDLTIKATGRKKRKVEEKRNLAYQGSSMQFFRSLYHDSLLQKHFVAYKLNEKPRPIYPTRFYIGDTLKFAAQKDSLHKLGAQPLSKKQLERNVNLDDKTVSPEQTKALKNKGFKVFNMDDVPIEVRMNATILNNPNFVDTRKNYLSLTKDTLLLYSFVSDTIGRLKVLKYSKPFQIKYTARGEEGSYIKQRYFGEEQQKFAQKIAEQSSFVIIKTGRLVFDKNGTYATVEDFIMGGYIGWRKIADLLPINFDPK